MPRSAAGRLALLGAPDLPRNVKGNMNAPSTPESTALVTAAGSGFDLTHLDAASLILGPAWERIQAFGKMMARGAVTIPKHLQGNDADCAAVTLQAIGWRMNPYAVAQKTHISQSGALGYEAQLVNAVIQASGELEGDPDYEYIGDWNKVLGKVEERRSDKGGKYYVATYTRQDEEGLGVIVKARLRGEPKARELTVMMSQAWPRFSTQWATDPKQQISYLALRKFVRLHKPGVLLGVYTNDELEPAGGGEKFMGPADVVPPGASTSTSEGAGAAARAGSAGGAPQWTDAEMAKREGKISEFYSKGKSADEIIAFYSTKGLLSDAQKQRIRALRPKDGGAAAASQSAAADQAQDVQPKVTYASVADKISKAQNVDHLADAGTLIGEVTDEQQRKELSDLYNARLAELKGA